MTTTVLAYFPSPGQGVWHLGAFPIRAYALCIMAGIVAALLIGDRRWAARGGERGVVYDIALWAVPFGLLGGRLYHLATDWKTYFGPGGAGLLAAVNIGQGGLGIWGAVALGAVGAWIGCRRRGIPLPAFGDAVAPGIVLAQAIGRLGNYFNQELYGRETAVPWGMEIFYRRDAATGTVDVHSLEGVSTGQVAAVVHPTFLYELLWNLLVFVFLIWADRRFRLGHGRLFALYVAAYCVGRFGVELMRDDTATHIAGIRINVFTAVFVFIGAIVYFLLAPKGRENPASLRGRQPLEVPHAESRVEEWTEDLVAAAAGSGVVAAATVAGEHEAEDYDTANETTDFIEPVETVDELAADEAEVDDEDEAEVEDAADAETATDAEADAEAGADAEVDAADEVEAAVAEAVESDAEADEAEVEIEVETEAQVEVQEADGEETVEKADVEIQDGDGETTASDETVVVYASDDEPETETVVVYESEADAVDAEAESGTEESVAQAEEAEVESDEIEAEAELEAEAEASEPEVEPEVDETEVEAAELEAEVEAAAADDAEANDAEIEAAEDEIEAAHDETESVDVEEPETEPESDVEPEPDPAPAPKPEPQPAVAPEPPAAPAVTEAAAADDVPPQKLGKTLKRLLWGAGSRSGK